MKLRVMKLDDQEDENGVNIDDDNETDETTQTMAKRKM